MTFSAVAAQQERDIGADDRVIAMPTDMTPSQFQQLGLQCLAYLEAVQMDDGAWVYVIHAADGTPLVTVGDANVAMALAWRNNLTLVPVH